MTWKSRLLWITIIGLNYFSIDQTWAKNLKSSQTQNLEKLAQEEGLTQICEQVPNSSARYCITETHGSNNRDVIFYYHCLFGDENNWLVVPQYRHVRARWRDVGFAAPRVVTISFGRSWLVAPKGESPKSGLYEEIQDKVLPYLEKRLVELGGGPVGNKMLLGLSLGGPNATEMFLHRPQDYTKMALLCPALSVVSPYASDEEVWDYIERSGAEPAHVLMALSIARDYFSPQDWELNSPLKLAPKKLPRGGADIFVFAGKSDAFGFYEGPMSFYDEARRSGGMVDFLDNDQGHCFFPSQVLADFLMNRPWK